jgi:hypothetical protein
MGKARQGLRALSKSQLDVHSNTMPMSSLS